MITTLLNTFLFVPVFSLAAILGFAYCRQGYKKGLWRALISFGASILSLILSIFSANLIAPFLSEAFVSLIPGEIFEEMGFAANFVLSLAEGLVKVFLSTLLFSVFFFLFLIILKLVSRKILPQKLDWKETDAKAFRWGGVFVRLFDALFVAIFLLLPLYGFLSTTVAPAGQVMMLVAKDEITEEGELKDIVTCVTNHPIIKLYQNPPCVWVTNSLSSFELNDTNIDLSKITGTVNEMVSLFDDLKNAAPEDRVQAIGDLTEFMRDNLVQETWCYDLLQSVKEEIVAGASDLLEGEDKEKLDQIVELLDVSQEEFAESTYALLDFVSYGLDNGLLEFAENKDVAALPEETFEKMGKWLNVNEHSQNLKETVISTVVEELFIQAYENQNMLNAKETAQNDFRDFSQRYIHNNDVSENQWDEEARALFNLFAAESEDDFRQALSQHPMFGSSAVAELDAKGIFSSFHN